MNGQKVITVLEGNLLKIILNFPEKMNCMGMEMMKSLQLAVNEAENNPLVKAVTIEGAGNRAFSTGADLREFGSLGTEQISEWITLGNQVFNQLEKLSKPTLALIRGYAYGGGLELALACDFRLAEKGATFCSPELKHGWLPGWGGIVRLRRLLGEAKAKEIVFLAKPIDTDRARQIGLITELSEKGALTALANDYLGELLQLDTSVFAMAKNGVQNNRSTSGNSLSFDIEAARYAKSRGNTDDHKS